MRRYLATHYFQVYLWELFWMRLEFELVGSVNCPSGVGGTHSGLWGPEQMKGGRRENLFLLSPTTEMGLRCSALRLEPIPKASLVFSSSDSDSFRLNYTISCPGLQFVDRERDAGMFSHWVTAWTVACKAPLSLRFPTQEYWSGWPFPFPRDLPDPGIEPVSPVSPALQAILYHWTTWDSLT